MSACLTPPVTRETRPATAGHDPVTRLRPSLGAAATTDLTDLEGWVAIRRRAHEVTTQLARTGDLPEHLTVGSADPAALAARTLAAAWRHVTEVTSSAPARRTA